MTSKTAFVDPYTGDYTGALCCGINYESVVDGEGVRVVVFMSGCLHNCSGCHNPESHDFHTGVPFDQKMQDEIIDYVMFTPYISGVTISGGDPMYSSEALLPFVKKLREKSERTTIWIYSGFTFEELLLSENHIQLLQHCDVLVDGRYVEALRDPLLKFRGSSNQRILDVKKSLEEGKAVLWQE